MKARPDFSRLDRLLEGFLADPKGPTGCVCGVSLDGEPVYTRYLGLADWEAGRPMGPDTLFDLWSCTKLAVCTAGLRLFEQGAFLLEEPLGDYIPEYRELTVAEPVRNTEWRLRPARRTLTVRDCFTMSCGLPYADGGSPHPTAAGMAQVMEELDRRGEPYDILTQARAMARVPLAFDPGTHWMYGYGHDLVAALIQACTGRPVSEFLRQEVFNPLGMADTGYRYAPGQRERMAAYCILEPDGTRRRGESLFTRYHEPEARLEMGGGGLITSLEDWLKLTAALSCGGSLGGTRILGRKTLELMRRDHLSPAQRQDFLHNAPGMDFLPGYSYGLGVRTLTDPAAAGSPGSPGEFGWAGGSGTWLLVDPEERLSIVYMQQLFPNREFALNPRVRNVVYSCLN